MAADPAVSQVVFKTAQAAEVRAPLLRVLPHSAAFEICDPTLVLRVSEALQDFKLVLRNRQQYFGRAVVRSLINNGPAMVVEVALEEKSWLNGSLTNGFDGRKGLGDDFDGFLRGWQKYYLVSDEYKVIIADLQTFLVELRLWLEQVELGIRARSPEERLRVQTEIAQDLRDRIILALSSMFQRFEEVTNRVEDDLQLAHRAFGQRQLHSHLLCAPFIHRTYSKPLGYAGDYEMMNMIVRNGFEGPSLFARLVNAYLLDQAPAHAVRNRVRFLQEHIVVETARLARSGRVAKILNIACGPAWEIRNFIAEHALAENAHFYLLDFNEETLNHTSHLVAEVKRRHGRRTQTEMVQNSVHKLLKADIRPTPDEPRYDFIYSSGLYDYLSNRVCKALNSYLYERLTPGGLLVVGNFANNNPIKRLMEHALEWFLIYRSGEQLASLSPDQAPPDQCVIKSEATGTNIFLEVRKPL